MRSPSILASSSLSLSPTSDIQSHLYNALLYARTPDVALHVRGACAWEGVYLLHRVVLIQADFFKSLFEGGFREAESRPASTSSLCRCFTVTFDDPNITRTAFEICIARLYGGGPALCVDPNLQPTRSNPLTPSFPPPSTSSSNPLNVSTGSTANPTTTTGRTSQIPADHHPATPRLLLSLVATGIYLSIPSIVEQAVRLILSSIGPYTAIRYLNFAIGKGIGDVGKLDGLEAPVGLEHIMRNPRSYVLDSAAPTVDTDVSSAPALASASAAVEELESLRKVSAADVVDRCHTDAAADVASDDRVFMYGPPANKIGEAVACWLCRWGIDMLEYEENTELSSSDIPQIWRREGGLDGRWACAVLSADAFFVRDEHTRYMAARRVVELRRGHEGMDLSEEREWGRLFSEGIHYTHMALDDLIEICRDVSPATGEAYVPASVVHAAHWEQSMLRHHIFQRHARPSDTSLSFGGVHRLRYPVPEDATSRIGESGSGTSGRQTVDDFFGIASSPSWSSSSPSSPSSPSWTVFPPMRFGVEFWGLDSLFSDGTRLTSQTIWYAGSLFHVYVQLSSSLQLGIYLRRLSAMETIPTPSLPPPPPLSPHARPATDTSRPTSPAESTISSPFSLSSISASPPLTPPTTTTSSTRRTVPPPAQPYRDPRESIRAHFTLLCASPTGNALTRFASAPDVFHVGRSWGWKSSAWQTEEYLGSREGGTQALPAKREVSLRAMVIIGVV